MSSGKLCAQIEQPQRNYMTHIKINKTTSTDSSQGRNPRFSQLITIIIKIEKEQHGQKKHY